MELMCGGLVFREIRTENERNFHRKDIVPALRILVFRENGLAFFLATGEA